MFNLKRMFKSFSILLLILLFCYLIWYFFSFKVYIGAYPFKNFTDMEEQVILEDFNIRKIDGLNITQLELPKEYNCVLKAFINADDAETLNNIFSSENVNVELLCPKILSDLQNNGDTFIQLQNYYINSNESDSININISKKADGYNITATKLELSDRSRDIIEKKQKGFFNIAKLILGQYFG